MLGPLTFVSAATGEGEGDPAAGQTNTHATTIGGGVLVVASGTGSAQSAPEVHTLYNKHSLSY